MFKLPIFILLFCFLWEVQSVILNRISAQKCSEYNIKRKADRCKVIGEYQGFAPLVTGGFRVMGGDTTEEFPHMALIGYKNTDNDDFKMVCGGSLISERFIMSSAFCSYTPELKAATYAKLGNVQRGSFNDNTLLVNIAERFRHPQFNTSSIDHNIVLFKLQETVKFNCFVRPLCLPQTNLEPKQAIFTGYGQVAYGASLSKNLLKVTLDIFNQTDCQKQFSLEGKTINGIDYETKICAGSYDKEIGVCGGDAGGPLQIIDQNDFMYKIIGVSSYGQANCGAKGIPDVFTRVYHYLSWIESVVWPENIIWH